MCENFLSSFDYSSRIFEPVQGFILFNTESKLNLQNKSQEPATFTANPAWITLLLM